MERHILESTDIDLRPHLANLCEDMGMCITAEAVREDPEVDLLEAINHLEKCYDIQAATSIAAAEHRSR
jgi:hypothetical protein